MPHFPPFRIQNRLSDWIGCSVEFQCRCGRVALPSVLMLMERRGDQTFADLLPRLRCEACGARPERVWLVAGQHRSCVGGPPADWAVEVLRPE